MFKKIFLTGAVLGLAMTFPLAQAAPQISGAMMGNTCAGCHGTQGRLQGEAFMPLAGMKEATFIKAMTT